MTSRALLAPLLVALAAPAHGLEFKVLAHPAQPTTALTRAQLSRLFLKKETRWPDGTVAKPVELTDGPLRTLFSRRVHQKSLAALHAYWTQMIFSGRDVPPLEKRTAAEVVEFVRTTPGAIGFVPSDAPAQGTRVVVIEE